MDVRQLSVQEASRDYPALWKAVSDLFPDGIEHQDIANLVSLVVGVCHYCYERERPCHCMDDV